MANLRPNEPSAVALDGAAAFTLDPVPPGGLYQARLFREGQGSGSGSGDILGTLDHPSLVREGRRDWLTACAERPMIDLTVGGTFVSMAFATSVPTLARVQLAASPPELNGAGLPSFPPGSVVAGAVSDTPALLHRISLVDELLQPETDGHTPLRTGQDLFFVVLAWNGTGLWDFLWNTTGKAPDTGPVPVTTKQRVVDVRLSHLHCHDDSDELSGGEAAFTFTVAHGGAPDGKTATWNPMETGSHRPVPVGVTDVRVDPPDAAAGVTVRVDGRDDDTGSFPPDDDDRASTHGLSGGTPLAFPVGEIKEEVTDRLLVLHSEPTTFSERLSFSASVVYSVGYV